MYVEYMCADCCSVYVCAERVFTCRVHRLSVQHGYTLRACRVHAPHTPRRHGCERWPTWGNAPPACAAPRSAAVKSLEGSASGRASHRPRLAAAGGGARRPCPRQSRLQTRTSALGRSPRSAAFLLKRETSTPACGTSTLSATQPSGSRRSRSAACWVQGQLRAASPSVLTSIAALLKASFAAK